MRPIVRLLVGPSQQWRHHLTSVRVCAQARAASVVALALMEEGPLAPPMGGQPAGELAYCWALLELGGLAGESVLPKQDWSG